MAEHAGALLALWNDVQSQDDAEYNDWHAREHVPQRLTVPGILWGWRLARVLPAAMPKYLTLYGLRDAAVLAGAPYLQLLREPTPRSRAMRPALLHVSRWVCALRTRGDLGDAARLAVRTWPEPLPTDAKGDPPHQDCAAAQLWARRLPDAPPLPWLSRHQSDSLAAVKGDWLHITCCATGRPAEQATIDGAAIYHRLPTG